MNPEQIKELDSVNMPLEGITLIEAAAGTGKTHNIQNIAARLIVEKNFAINRIVIVTFTELAAKELAERLRSVLESLAKVLQGETLADVSQQKRSEELLHSFDRHGIEAKDQLERVKNALADFDDNRVSTIHGFCARILNENAFESSVLFRTRLEKNIDQYVDKLLGDFCRMKRYGSSPCPEALQASKEQFSGFVKMLLYRSELKCEYNCQIFDGENALDNEINQVIAELKTLDDAPGVLRGLPGKLNKINDRPGDEYIEYYAYLLKKLLQTDAPAEEFKSVLENITSEILIGKSSARPKGNVELNTTYIKENKLFALTDKYISLCGACRQILLENEAFKFVKKNLKAWKQRDNFHGFDDMLKNVLAALGNEKLCRMLREKFSAAIIDEFQDTDPVQYAIFKKIFIDGSHQHTFFMVGDPRQAIYSFRGGDLATYMTARSECLASPDGRICKLSCNYRSSGKMIDSFNKFFRHNNLFAAGDLQLPDAQAPENAKKGIHFDGEEMDNPLQVSCMMLDNAASCYKKCALNIVKMLNDHRFQLPDKDGVLQPIKPGDIAVLAFDKRELENVRNELIRWNVPVVCEHKNGIWSSPEAADLAVFLRAVIEPQRESNIAEALLTPLCSVSLAGLDKLYLWADERMTRWRMIFEDLKDVWLKDGVSGMLGKAFITDFPEDGNTFKQRMAISRNGTRRIANYTQLGDMLAAMELASHLSPQGVLNKLKAQIAAGEVDDESAEMLESDNTAVRLITVHSSKGLQFPVVFLPFMASRYPGKRKDTLRTYHRNGVLCCNPDRSDASALMLALQEELQELMRLTYVAVTRAGSYCFVGWGQNKSGNTSAMDWLFRMNDVDFKDNEEKTINSFIDKGFRDKKLNIPPGLQFTGISDDSFLKIYQETTAEVKLVEPPEVQLLPDDWRLISYSALNVNNTAPAEDFFDEAVDYDQADDAVDNDEQSSGTLQGGIWDIPGGAAVGNAWHNILEELDFTAAVDPAAVSRRMKLYGFEDEHYCTETCRMLENLLQYDLPLPAGGAFKLADITMKQRRSEFEFLLGVSGEITMSRLLAAVEPYLQENYCALYRSGDESLLRGGFFTGFMDLLFEYQGRFYIVDWKSNTLNRRAENFSGEKLKHSMFEATYPLQYLFYTAALVKYLEHKLQREINEALYSKYFGGVYYIFLRGMCLDIPAGVYAARPPLAVILKLLEALGCRSRKDSL